MKTTAKKSDWDVSFWFAISSPLLGVLLATIALTIFVLEKSNRGLRGLNGSEGICVSSAVSAVQQFFKFF